MPAMAQSVMIQTLTQIDSAEQLEQLPPDSVSEVILAHKRLSRLGKLETEPLAKKYNNGNLMVK